MMASGLITDSLIASCFARELGKRLEDNTSAFNCHIEFRLPKIARTWMLDDFWDWYVRPNVIAALCYAENGAGEPLEVPYNVAGDVKEWCGAQVRYIHIYQPGTGHSRHRLDIRYPV